METRDDILRELKEIAPELSKLEKNNFGEVPADYFTLFSGTLLKKIREQELAKIAPTLAKQKTENTLEVPANYFNSFPGQMLKKIPSEQKQKTSPSWLDSLNNILEGLASIIFKPRYAFAVAGTVAMLIIGVMFFSKTEQTICAPDDLVCQLEMVSDEELDSYIYSNADDYQKSVLDISTDDKKIQNQSDNINDELKILLNELDDESLNNI